MTSNLIKPLRNLFSFFSVDLIMKQLKMCELQNFAHYANERIWIFNDPKPDERKEHYAT